MMMQTTLLFLAFISVVKAQEDLCPPPAQIIPCVCQVTGNRPSIDCVDINDEEELAEIFMADYPETALQNFRLTDSFLTQISRNVFGNISFEDVYIRTDYIDAISEDAFENSIETLIKLEVDNCPVTSTSFPFASMESYTNLYELSFDENLLTEFPIVKSDTLQVLVIWHNEYVRELPADAVSGIPQLTRLDLLGCGISTIDNNAFQGTEQHIEYISLTVNEITSVTPTLFMNLPNLEVLNLSSNNITEIQIGAFSDLPSLKRLDLGTNHISILNSTTFEDNPSLDVLILLSNDLAYIEPGTFSGNSMLTNLDLGPNNITRLYTGTFDGLNTTSIALSSNKINYIEANAFGDISSSSINLSYNELTTLYEFWLRPLLDAQNYVYLYGNELGCGCEIAWLFEDPSYQNLVYGSCQNGTAIYNLNPDYYQNNC